jgi:hypothetical protein
LLYPLLSWLLVTNKAHLRPLRQDERFDGYCVRNKPGLSLPLASARARNHGLFPARRLFSFLVPLPSFFLVSFPKPTAARLFSFSLFGKTEKKPKTRLGTPFQFVLLSGPVEREQKFQALKQAHGSVFSWHGSGSGNWHVILRTSLQNMSNTKHMSAGAAFGSGIYLANNLQVLSQRTSFPSARMGPQGAF